MNSFWNESHSGIMWTAPYAAVKSILKANLQEHSLKRHRVNIHYSHVRKNIVAQYGTGVYKLLHRMASKSLQTERRESLRTKNNKLSKLLGTKHHENNFSVTIINLSGQVVADSILHYLRHGLNHTFIDKNRLVKLNLLSEFEFLLTQVSFSVPINQHEV